MRLKVYGGQIVAEETGQPVLCWGVPAGGDLLASTEWMNALVDAYNAAQERAGGESPADYLPLSVAATATGDNAASLRRACNDDLRRPEGEKRVPGARIFGSLWLIPARLVKPDQRILGSPGKPRKPTG